MEKMDRRVKYTKHVLKETLIALMKENHISKISVKQICEIGDVNRSTFYAHYKDPYDLLSQIEQETLSDIQSLIFNNLPQKQTRIPRESLCIILKYAAQNAELFQILLSERTDLAFRKELIKMVKELGLIENRLRYKNKEKVAKYIQLYALNGTISILSEWLRAGMVEPIEEIADMLNWLNLGIDGSP